MTPHNTDDAVTRAVLHAATAAAYYIELVRRGIPDAAAMNMAAQYISTLIFQELQQAATKPPKEPWEPA